MSYFQTSVPGQVDRPALRLALLETLLIELLQSVQVYTGNDVHVGVPLEKLIPVNHHLTAGQFSMQLDCAVLGVTRSHHARLVQCDRHGDRVARYVLG